MNYTIKLPDINIIFEDELSAISLANQLKTKVFNLKTTKSLHGNYLRFKDYKEYNQAIESIENVDYNVQELIKNKIENQIFLYCKEGYKEGTKVVVTSAGYSTTPKWQALEKHFQRTRYSEDTFHRDFKEHEFKVVNKCYHPEDNDIIYHVKSDNGCELFTSAESTFSIADYKEKLKKEGIELDKKNNYLKGLKFDKDKLELTSEKRIREQVPSELIKEMYCLDRAVVLDSCQNVSIIIYHIPKENSINGKPIWLWYLCLYDGGKKAKEITDKTWNDVFKLF